jgi:outer membrane receptor protein involved in Fe transport
VLPLYFANDVRGATYGAEASVQYQVSDALLFKGNYSRLQMNLRGLGDQLVADSEEGNSPQNRAYAGATLRLPRGLELAGDVYLTGAVPTLAVPEYTRLDLSAGWKLRDPLRLKIAAQNLLGAHMEHGAAPSPANAVKPTVYAELVVAF